MDTFIHMVSFGFAISAKLGIATWMGITGREVFLKNEVCIRMWAYASLQSGKLRARKKKYIKVPMRALRKFEGTRHTMKCEFLMGKKKGRKKKKYYYLSCWQIERSENGIPAGSASVGHFIVLKTSRFTHAEKVSCRKVLGVSWGYLPGTHTRR